MSVAVYRASWNPVKDMPLVAFDIVYDYPDRALLTKLIEFKTIGIPHVWLAAPKFRALLIFERGAGPFLTALES